VSGVRVYTFFGQTDDAPRPFAARALASDTAARRAAVEALRERPGWGVVTVYEDARMVGRAAMGPVRFGSGPPVVGALQ
jgi:hypothetical protein